MNLDDAIAALRDSHQPLPKPARLPTATEVHAAERRLDVTFHADFRRYLLEASDVCCGVLEPVTITKPDSHTDLIRVVQEAWSMGLPRELMPLCEDNADYYCLSAKGEVVFWSHNGTTAEKWRNLAHWIEEVWLEGEFDAEDEDD